jgi:hypothetical protein
MRRASKRSPTEGASPSRRGEKARRAGARGRSGAARLHSPCVGARPRIALRAAPPARRRSRLRELARRPGQSRARARSRRLDGTRPHSTAGTIRGVSSPASRHASATAPWEAACRTRRSSPVASVLQRIRDQVREHPVERCKIHNCLEARWNSDRHGVRPGSASDGPAPRSWEGDEPAQGRFGSPSGRARRSSNCSAGFRIRAVCSRSAVGEPGAPAQPGRPLFRST